MSKSLGNVLDPFEVMDRFGTDALRYYCFREVSFGQDGGVSTTTFGERYETELANEYGNLASRTLDDDRPLPRRRRARRRTSTRRWPPTSTASRERGRALLDRAEITQALERIWQRVRRLNRYVEERAPWQLAKDPRRRPASSTPTLRSLAEGLRVVTVLLHAVHAGDDRRSCWPRSATTRARARAPPATAPARAARAVDEARRRCSRSRSDRQPHPPRPRRPAPEAELVAAAREAGRRRASSRSGSTRESLPRRARRRRGATREVFAAIGRHPNDADRLRRRGHATSCASSRAHPRCLAIGETGLDYYRDYAPRADQERAFAAQIELARETGKPLVIHTRAAEDDTIATLAARRAGPRGRSCTASRCPTGSTSASSTAGGSRSPATSPTRRRTTSREAAERVPLDRLLVETDAPYLTPQAVRKQRNQPAYVVHTARFVAERRGIAYEELEAAVEAQRRRAVRLVSELPAQPSLRRHAAVRRSGPNRELGQNFLIDSNILDVIGARRRARRRATSCSRSAAGSACCREYLAERAAHVHVVEVDRAPRAARCATRSTRTRTPRCTSPTRSSSTSPRSTRRRPRSSPTSLRRRRRR